MRVASLIGIIGMTAGALAVPGTGAAAHVDVVIGVAPPAPRVEVVPAPRTGYVWSPGYWRWNGHHHYWVGGYWIPARAGYHWVPSHWAPYHHSHWRYVSGYWAH